MHSDKLSEMHPDEILGHYLVRSRMISHEQLYRALKWQKEKGCRLGDALFRLGYISQDDLTRVLSRQLDIPPLDPDELDAVDGDVLALFSPETAQRLQAVPLRMEGDRLLVAISDQRTVDQLGRIQTPRGDYTLSPRLASPGALSQALSRYYNLPESAPETPPESVSAAPAPPVLEGGPEEGKGIVDFTESVFHAQRAPDVLTLLKDFSSGLFDWTGAYHIVNGDEAPVFEGEDRLGIIRPRGRLLQLLHHGATVFSALPVWACKQVLTAPQYIFISYLDIVSASKYLWLGTSKLPLAEPTLHDLEILSEEAVTALRLMN